MAGSAFKNADVVKVLSNFTPILVDGDTEKEAKAKYRVNGYPNTIFADAKGEPVGQPIVGAVPVDQFLKQAQDFAKKIKPGRPSKDYATLTAAKKKLDDATAKKQVGPAIAAIAEIEKVNHPGAILDAATAEKARLMDEGRKRLDAAKEAAKADDKAPALVELKKIAQDYKGTDLGKEAANLVKALQPKDAGAK